jgi:L-seryl-tRNA(Ser) seleniumtransferase
MDYAAVMSPDSYSQLPSIARLLAHKSTERLLVQFNRENVVTGCGDILEELRRALGEGFAIDPEALEPEAILSRLESRLAAAARVGLQRVVNASGLLIHTHLGRALLPHAAVDALVRAATQPINLEYDLAQGDRGPREETIADLLMDLTGAEAATVVNNNAGAVLLALNTLATGKEVLVPRGAPAEMGGPFRMLDLMGRTGAVVKEVGTEHGATLGDYERAIGERTAVIVRLHAGDDITDLVALARRRGIAMMENLGAAALVDLSRRGLSKAPLISQRVAAGVDVVSFSGDKIVGGPQAGLIVGRSAAVDPLSRNALHRALRCDKLTIAALEITLRMYRESASVIHDMPVLRVLTRPLEDIEDTARRALPALASALGVGFRVSIQDSTSKTTSDGRHDDAIPTKVIIIEHDYLGATRIASRFRQARPPIIGTIKDDWFALDARSVFDPLDLVPNWGDELDVGPGPQP